MGRRHRGGEGGVSQMLQGEAKWVDACTGETCEGVTFFEKNTDL